MLCAFVGALFLLVSDLEQYQSSFPRGLCCLSSSGVFAQQRV